MKNSAKCGNYIKFTMSREKTSKPAEEHPENADEPETLLKNGKCRQRPRRGERLGQRVSRARRSSP